MTSKENN